MGANMTQQSTTPPAGPNPYAAPTQEEMTQQVIDSVLAMNKANLEAAPTFAKFCGKLKDYLIEDGFSREEAIDIIKAAVKK
jgi:hypothetical protein